MLLHIVLRIVARYTSMDRDTTTVTACVYVGKNFRGHGRHDSTEEKFSERKEERFNEQNGL